MTTTIIEPGAAAVNRHRPKLGATALVAAVATLLGFVAVASDEIGIQGRWAYSRQAAPGDMIDMATTPALQDADVWLLVACDGNGRLSVVVMHSERFSFDIDESSSVQLQSARLGSTSVVARRTQSSHIEIDPNLVRHIMPLLLDEQELSLSITARDGAVHRYTFTLQPNDVALAPLRSRCLPRE